MSALMFFAGFIFLVVMVCTNLYINRHSLEALSVDTAFSFGGLIVWAIIGLLIGDVYSLLPTFALGKIVDSTQTLRGLSNSRRAEYQADEVGMYLAAEACYDISVAPAIWERFVNLEGGVTDSPLTDYLMTHPNSAARRNRAAALIPHILEVSSETNCSSLRDASRRFKKHIMHNLLGAKDFSHSTAKPAGPVELVPYLPIEDESEE